MGAYLQLTLSSIGVDDALRNGSAFSSVESFLKIVVLKKLLRIIVEFTMGLQNLQTTLV